jgi:hypothetical protein
MKKIILLLIVAALLLSTNRVHAQSDWVNYKIDSKLSVKLPNQPASANGATTVQTKDSLTCFVMVINMMTAGKIDSATLANLAPTDDFTNGIKAGMLGKLPGATLGDVKTGKWNGYYCYNIDGYTSKKLRLYFYIIIIGDDVYCLGTIFPEKLGAKSKDDFFNSLALN